MLRIVPLALVLAMGVSAPTPAQEDLDKPPAKQTLTGHRGVITSLTFTADGKTLVAGGGDENTVRLWDLATGKSKTWPEHPDLVRSVVLTPDGKTAAVGCRDGHVYIHDFPSGKERRKLKHGADMSLAISPDGTTVAACGDSKTISLWTIADGKLVTTLEHESDDPRDGTKPVKLAFGTDGEKLYVGYGGVEVRGHLAIFDMATRKRTATVAAQAGVIARSANGARIALGGSFQDEMKLYDTTDGFRYLRRVRFDEQHGQGAAFSPDGKLLATLSSDGNRGSSVARLWAVGHGKKLLSWKAHDAWGAQAIAFSPDGKKLATGGWADKEKLIHVWDVPGEMK